MASDSTGLGFPPLDRNALANILVRVCELGRLVPHIQEIDINPLMVQNGRPTAVDASIIVRTEAP